MLRVLGVFAASCAVLLTAAPARADLTPAGPASFMNRWTGVSASVLTSPAVLMNVRVTVGDGGQAGTVRVQGMSDGVTKPSENAAFETPKVGPAAVLPAQPGTYTLPAPRVHMGEFFTSRIGLVQETGNHAIVDVRPCTPENGQFGDLCQVMWLDGWPGGSRGGAWLKLEPLTEPDLDRDLRGDGTEDRTDLRMSATTSRAADGRLRTEVVVANAGPLDADLPVLETEGEASGRPPLATATRSGWESGCEAPAQWGRIVVESCSLVPLAAGKSRTLVYISNGPEKIVARAEGPDLAPADNVLHVADVKSTPPVEKPKGKAARAAVSVKGIATLRRGIKLRVSGEGRSRVTAAFTVRGRTVRLTRTVTLRRDVARQVTLRVSGTKLRTLRRAASRGTLWARITLRTAAGTVTAQGATIVKR